MARTKLTRIAGSAALLLLGACASLDVKNPNNPDIKRALASGEDVKAIAISTMNSWYITSTDVYPYIMLEVTADAMTANFGNFAMRFNNDEPRIPYNNSSTAVNDGPAASEPWDNNYGTLGAANDVLKALALGVQINGGLEDDKWRALALWTQAASLSNLALLFDSAFVVDETSTGPPALVKYDAVTTAALAKWDATLTALAGKTEDYGSPVLPLTGVSLSSSTLRRFGASLAAATLRYSPRTPAELNAKPAAFWTSLLTYAEAGLSGTGVTSFNVSVLGDGCNVWCSILTYYGAEDQWTRIDYRLLNRMENVNVACATSIPIRYGGTGDIRSPGCPTTNDQRLRDGDVGRWTGSGALTAPNKDFRYYGDHPSSARRVIGDPGRGIWKQSAYAHERYQPHSRSSATPGQTSVPYMLAAENDLFIAEALIRTAGDRTRAATLINNTRVTRGGLPGIVSGNTDAQFYEAIDYERDVELLNTDGFALFIARNSPSTTPLGASANGGRIQTGTLRHLPIPAKELETLAKKIYTYGGTAAGTTELVVIGGNGEMVRLRKPVARLRMAEKFFERKN